MRFRLSIILVAAMIGLSTAFLSHREMNAVTPHNEHPKISSSLQATDNGGFVPPSISQVLYAWLAVVAGSRLIDSVPRFLADTSATNLALNVALNAVLATGATAAIVNSLQPISYQDLEDLNTKSLAKQAGVWALEGTVPTTYNQEYAVATFAGGCFWGTELHFQRIPGVIATCVGYTQGSVDKPTYEQVCSGFTGHTEGIQLIYDPKVCSYERLLTKLFQTIDPTLLNRVGNDRGTQYRHGVYFHTDEQREEATRFVEAAQNRYKDPVVTEVLPAKIFWPAENYHQRYLEKGGQSAEKNCEDRVRCYG